MRKFLKSLELFNHFREFGTILELFRVQNHFFPQNALILANLSALKSLCYEFQNGELKFCRTMVFKWFRVYDPW
jgi:hypothetical protein